MSYAGFGDCATDFLLALRGAVGVCTITDVSVSIFGFLAASAAVLTTSLQQIYIGQLQKEYSIGSFDLLSQTAPIQVLKLSFSTGS